MLKLKIPKQSPAPDGEQASQPTPTASTPGGFKLKLSAPPTPASEQGEGSITVTPAAERKKKRPYQRKDPGEGGGRKGAGKKRAANDDIVSPAAKRVASGGAAGRRVSLKLSTSATADDGSKSLNRIPLMKRNASLPKIVDLRARQRAPPRPKGVGYDSEDSDAETDPAIQQVLMLRMAPGEDADYLREAIASGRIGPHPSQGDAEVSLKFVEKNYRRAIVKVRGHSYAAVLLELPTLVESMKSFDRKGWWKVADIAQMLLVLGRCQSEEEAKNYPLPREVDKNKMEFAHGLTPPLHWVRKRRFRKRRNHTDQRNVEEEVERLLAEDKQWEEAGGQVRIDFQDRNDPEQSQEPYGDGDGDEDADADADADGEAVETIENDDAEYEEEDNAAAMEAEIQAMFDNEVDDAPTASQLVSDSPAPIADQAASMSAVEAAMQDSEATPVGTPAQTPLADEQSSDEDESDEDEDSPDVVDEDAAAKAAERAQQLEEVADLEREVERARQKVKAMTNQLLRQREMQKLAALEEDLRVKRGVFGLDTED